MPDKKITAYHVDTCLSDYLQDSYSRDGQTLCFSPLGGTLEETVQTLFESMMDCVVPESITDDQIKAALRAAIQHSDLRYIDGDGNPCDETPEETSDDEEPYLYAALVWWDVDADGAPCV